MKREIAIQAGTVLVMAELSNTQAADKIYGALPIEGRAQTWGEEIYFEIPVTASLDETAREVVDPGDLGYWPTGRAFCIFFGPTPASRGSEIRAASAVSIVGKVEGDLSPLKNVGDGEPVRLFVRDQR
ncbi:MAG: cyclophilin-like fold protein [bacterium]|nr:cyclophilin-like fold protein [bacterium]